MINKSLVALIKKKEKEENTNANMWNERGDRT